MTLHVVQMWTCCEMWRKYANIMWQNTTFLVTMGQHRGTFAVRDDKSPGRARAAEANTNTGGMTI